MIRHRPSSRPCLAAAATCIPFGMRQFTASPVRNRHVVCSADPYRRHFDASISACPAEYNAVTVPCTLQSCWVREVFVNLDRFVNDGTTRHVRSAGTGSRSGCARRSARRSARSAARPSGWSRSTARPTASTWRRRARTRRRSCSAARSGTSRSSCRIVSELTDTQSRLLLLFQSATVQHASGALPPLRDEDVAEAAAASASTLETARKGIIYEHQAVSVPAQRLTAELGRVVAELSAQAGSQQARLERDAAVALRRMEQGAARPAGRQPARRRRGPGLSQPARRGC